MRNILIISPHYPPSNLAAVHRSRLFAQHLAAYGWHPVILTVDEKYYEEELDWNLHNLLPKDQRIEKVKAFKITNPRFSLEPPITNVIDFADDHVTKQRNKQVRNIFYMICKSNEEN